MKKLIAIGLLLIATAAWAASCPLDNRRGVKTGFCKYSYEGVRMCEYECYNGHTWWEAQ